MDGLCDFLDGKLANNECGISEVEIKRGLYEPTTLKCKLEVNLTSDDERNLIIRSEYGERFTGGWTNPRERAIEKIMERNLKNCRYGWNSHSDDAVDSMALYCRNDWRSVREALEHKKHNKIKKVIFNNPATIVFWKDGSKTVVKCRDEEFDPEKGLAMAIAKHFLGTDKTKYNYYEIFKKWLPKEEMTDEEKKIGNTILESVSLHPFEETLVISETIKEDIIKGVIDSLKKSDKDNIKEVNEAVSDAVHKTASMFRSETKENACDNIIDSLKKSDEDTDINL